MNLQVEGYMRRYLGTRGRGWKLGRRRIRISKLRVQEIRTLRAEVLPE